MFGSVREPRGVLHPVRVAHDAPAVPTFDSAFPMLGSPALDSDGSLVYAHARFRDVPPSSRIVVELVGVTGPIAQGLVVRTTAGKLLLGDHREEAFVLWTATMPGRVELETTNRKPGWDARAQ